MLKLVSNWRAIALRSHSMWAVYIGLALLVMPEALFAFAQVDTNPRIWYLGGIAGLVFGGVGRLWDQGIDRDKMHSPLWIAVLAVLAVLVGLNGGFQKVPKVAASLLEPVAVDVGRNHERAFFDLAIPFIGTWEGLRLTAYQDVVGVWTVCYGETKGVKRGDTYTKAQCGAMFERELISYRNGLHRAFSDPVKASLPVPRDVAFVSLAYNVGVAGAAKSTAVRRLNAGDVNGACAALGWWNKAGGRVVRGLVNRRSAETELCLQGTA